MSNVLKENYKKLVDALAPYFGGASDFDDLTNRPLESDAIDIDDLDLPMPAKPTDYPILFDETGTEYKVGLYKRASDGKVKPVWRKDIVKTNPGTLVTGTTSISTGISNIENIHDIKMMVTRTNSLNEVYVFPVPKTNYDGVNYQIGINYNKTNNTIDILQDGNWNNDNWIMNITLEYTKTTDSWKEV